MKVKFTRDVFNAGNKMYETGKEYEGDLERYVRRGEAEEVKGQAVAPKPAPKAKTKAKTKGKK
jgi:hypothetical protein